MFPKVPWGKIMAGLDSAYEQWGEPTEFRPHDSVQAFTLKATRGHKRDGTMTDGMQQTGFKIRVRMSEWDAAYPRPPEQGDQVVSNGRRMAVESAHPVIVAGNETVYVLTMQG